MNIQPKRGDTIVVWFSCGAASAVAAKKTIEKYGMDCCIKVVNNPVKEEHPDNRRFLSDIETWINKKIEIAINDQYPDCSAQKVWEDRKYMSGNDGAPCTVQLKKEARKQWEMKNPFDWLVLGFTSEEQARADNFIRYERRNLIPILLHEGISKQDCIHILQKEGIEIPEMYRLGYPNANCIGCVKASSPTYWNHVRKVDPRVFEARAKLSRELGVRLVRVKGVRIFLDELKPTDTGASLKSMQIECGIFCETHPGKSNS